MKSTFELAAERIHAALEANGSVTESRFIKAMIEEGFSKHEVMTFVYC